MRLVPFLWKSTSSILALELPLLVAVSALVTFFVALPLKGPMDGFLYQVRAGYDRIDVQTGGPAPVGGLKVERLVDFPVAPQPGPGQSLAYTPLLTRLDLDIVDDLAAYRAKAIGGNLIVGGEAPGILLDADSALRMNVHVGDKVVLLISLLVDGQSPPVLTVAGLLQPYASPDDPAKHGLAVVERGLVPAAFLDTVSGTDLQSVMREEVEFDGPAVSGSMGRAEAAMAFVLQLFSTNWLPILGGVLLFAVLLFTSVVARSTGHAIRRVRGTGALLVAMGATSREVAAAIIGPQVLFTVGALLAGTLLVTLGFFPLLLHWTLQPGAAVPSVALLLIVVLVHAAITVNRTAARLRDQTLIVLLAPKEG